MEAVFARIDGFCANVRAAPDTAALSALVGDEVARLGFDHYTYWLKSAPSGRLVRFFFGNYPADWAERYAAQAYETNDLIIHRLNQMVVPFTWGDVTQTTRLTKAQRSFFNEAGEHGLTSGAAVPVNGPGAARAHLVVASSLGEHELNRLFAEHKHTLHLIAAYTHDRALEFLESPPDLGPTRLTAREFEILKWIVQGKTNWEIGEILSVSEATVKEHVRNICDKFGVHTKMHAASLALWHGYTSL